MPTRLPALLTSAVSAAASTALVSPTPTAGAGGDGGSADHLRPSVEQLVHLAALVRSAAPGAGTPHTSATPAGDLQVLAAAPILRTLDALDAMHCLVALVDPHGIARHVLAWIAQQLREATTVATPTPCIDIEAIVRQTGRAKSTITDWCARYGDGDWARKHADTWLVDGPKFNAWYELNRAALERRRRVGAAPRGTVRGDSGRGTPAARLAADSERAA